MRPRLFIALIGFMLIIAGTYCPLLRPFHLFNMNLYALNKPYGMVVLVTAAAGVAAVVTGRRSAARVIAWLSFLLILLIFFAAILRVNTSFSFIPFKNIAAGLSGLIKFRYGWAFLFAGSILALIGSAGKTNKVVYRPVK